MNRHFVINDPRTAKFVADSVGSTDTQCHSSIGLEIDGKLVAGATFDNYSGPNIFLHFSNSPVGIIPRDFLKLIFGYCFNGLKCKRVSAAFSSNNYKVCRLGKLIGFKLEACLKDCFPDGDMLIYSLKREDCRFIV